jgi:NADPH:quinone reductase-like Zn-dependent oxidoreductase
VREGRIGLSLTLPVTPGADLSGVVVEADDGVEDLASGDAIFGVTNDRFVGAYAEFAVADASRIARKPAGLGFIEAAGSEHVISENASATEPASLLAVHIAGVGARLTTMVK